VKSFGIFGVGKLVICSPGDDAAFQYRNTLLVEDPPERSGCEHVRMCIIHVICRDKS
jgi:hypothetical protein